MANINVKLEPSHFIQPDNEREEENVILSFDTENAPNQKICKIQDQLIAANKKIMDLTLEMERLKSQKDEQFQSFESDLRKADDMAKEWKNKFNEMSEGYNNLQKRILELKMQTSNDTKPSLKRLKVCDKENEYEVDALLNHKRSFGKIYYLIRWKHFDSSHDTWEQEANLNCLTLLNRYKKQNNLI